MEVAEKAFGARVRAHRKAAKLTQARLAERLGLSEEWVRRIEGGEAKPSFETIIALAGQLSVPPTALFAGIATSAPESPLARLIEQVMSLTPDEVSWVSGLVDHMVRRPARSIGKMRPGDDATASGQAGLSFEQRVERVVQAFRLLPPTETEQKVIMALLDHPGSTSAELSGHLGWNGQTWHAHFGRMISNRRSNLWEGDWMPSREAEFYSGILADLSEPDHKFTMRPEAMAGFAIIGITPTRFR